MKVYSSFASIDKQVHIIVKNQIVTEISQSFTNMTQYQIDELVNKTISEVFITLKIGPNLRIENIDEQVDYFLFTKSLDVRFVNIEVIEEIDKQVYIISENPNSRLEDNLPYIEYIYKTNKSGVAIYSAPDLTLLKANETYINFLNEPFNIKENCIGRKLEEIVKGYKGSVCEEIWENLLNTGEVFYANEISYDRYDRGITYWDSSIVPIYENGKIKYFIENSNEVTERVLYRKIIEEQSMKLKQQAEELEEQNKKLKQQKELIEATIDTMNDAVAIFDNSGNGVLRNAEARRMYPDITTETKYEHVHGRYECCDLENNIIPVEDLPTRRVLKGERIRNERIIVKYSDKSIFVEINAVPVLDDKNNLISAVVTHRDISKMVEYEKELRKQNELLKAIIENMSDAFSIFDKYGNQIHTNNISDDMKSQYAFGGKSIRERYEANPPYNSDNNIIPYEEMPAIRVINGEQFKNVRLTYKMPDLLHLKINGSPIYDNDGNLILGILCLDDITKEVEREELIKKQQEVLLNSQIEKNEILEKAIEMKDEFLTLISHEFRTPLNVISTAIQAMNYLCWDEVPEKAKKYINTIRQNTFRQLRLVNNLLDITRIDAGRIKIHKKNIDMVFLTKSIVESVYTYASQKGVAITFTSSIAEKIMGIDDEKYERILLNLLSNAIKFTPVGKLITVKLRTIKNKICVEVKDNGIGIPDDKIDVIFDKFGQVDSSLSRQAEGSGIGLSLVKRFVEALDGSISVKSKVGKGSAFKIMLPDEQVLEATGIDIETTSNLMDNRLVQTTIVEFSDIYL